MSEKFGEAVSLNKLASSGEYSASEEAIFRSAANELILYRKFLKERDDFIVQSDMWIPFIEWLRAKG